MASNEDAGFRKKKSKRKEGLSEVNPGDVLTDVKKEKKKKKKLKHSDGNDAAAADDHSHDDGNGSERYASEETKEAEHNGDHLPEANEKQGLDKNMEHNNKTKKKSSKKKRDRWGQIINDAHENYVAENESVYRHELDFAEDTNSQSQSDEYDKHAICVGGMPYDTTEEDILNHFGSCGTVKQVMCAKFADTNRFKGLAFITFEEEESVSNALELDGSPMGARHIKVDRVKKGEIFEKKRAKAFLDPPKREEGSLSVYIGNLDWNVQKIDVKRFFKGCDIDNVRLAADKSTGKFLGYGHVDFSDDASLDKAVKMDQNLMLGRPVRVSYAVPKGFKSRLG